MDHKGLATVGPFTPELDAVFVNVSLVPCPPQQIGPGVLPRPPDDRAGRHVLGDFLGRRKPAVWPMVWSSIPPDEMTAYRGRARRWTTCSIASGPQRPMFGSGWPDQPERVAVLAGTAVTAHGLPLGQP